jgi:hypothetical protein
MTLPLRWPIICSALVALSQVYAAPECETCQSERPLNDQTHVQVAAPHCEHYSVHMERSYLVWCPPESRRY